MIGDLISILILGVIWWRIFKLKKNDFSRFLVEITIYFLAFIFTLLFYKLFFSIAVSIFHESLYPSIVGIFAASLIFIYILFKLAIFLIDRKKPALEIENKIYNFAVRTLDFINPTTEDFNKVFLLFAVINLIIIGTLFNSLADTFSFKKKLYAGSNYSQNIYLKEQQLINKISGNDTFRYNIAKTLEFLRLTNPYYYQQVIENTERIDISDNNLAGGALAEANSSSLSITFNPKYGQRKYDKIKEYLTLGAILIHESQHLKDFRMLKGEKGLNFFAYFGGEVYFKIACNPITNYEYFRQIFRATHAYFDEWCAQIEEVKFLRMYNVDFKNDNELRELFR